jgi:two-component system, sensor histidine kinase YesM
VFKIKGSIRNKLILFLLLATLLPIGTSIAITYFYTKDAMTQNSIHENRRLLFQGMTNLKHYVNNIDQSTLTVYSDVNFYSILNMGYQNTSEQKSILLRNMQVSYRAVKETHQVHLDSTRSTEHFLYVNDRFPTAPRASSQPVTFSEDYHSYVEPTHMSHNYGVAQYPEPSSIPVFTYHRPIYKIPSSELLGTLSVDIKLDFVERLSKELYDEEHEELYLMDQSGVIVYSSNREEWGQQLNRNWAATLQNGTEDQGVIEWKSDGFSGILIYERIVTPYMSWMLVKQVPYSYLYEHARELTRINVGVFTLFLIVVIAATIYISIRFTSPIRLLISTINKIQGGQLNVDIDVRGTDEIGVLARRFRLMMQSLNELIVREYALELANKTNELKALQAQINPHFLNNALQSIGTLALQHQEIKIYSLIASLGKMMRYHMNADEIIVPLQKEIDYVKGYLELQQQRFDERLQVEIVTDPEAQQVTLPKMTLQPIVENYFKHGYDSTQGGQIRIECSLSQEGELRISVADNGKGMEQEELEALRQKLEQGTGLGGSGADSIGLLNVISRIKLYFNEGARMNVSHAEPQGLKVELYIPTEHGNGGETE